MKAKPARQPTSQKCYEQLRQLLLYRQLTPGGRLVEVEWSQRLGVHRAAVREAMSLLAHEGLLQRGKKGGVFVPILEQRDIDEVWEARMILEVGALQLIAKRRLDKDALNPLLDFCDTQQYLVDKGMEFGYMEADRKFHEALIELADNERLSTMYRRSALPHIAPRIDDPQSLRQSREKTIQEHREIYRLIVERQIDKATELLKQHLHMSPP